MRTSEPIDLEKQLADLLRKESMLAFFDFTMPLTNRSPVSGIVKIAKPREGKSKARYLAVLFIVDTPTEAVRKAVSTAFNRMDWQSLARGGLPGCRSIIPIPYVNLGTDLYFLEADLYLTDAVEATQPFLEGQVVPALGRVTRLKPGELAMWEDAPTAGAQVASLFARLRKLFA